MTREEIIQRRKDIYNMRESGMKYKDIAAYYGVTAVRVRQLYLKQKRIYDYEKLGIDVWRYYK